VTACGEHRSPTQVGPTSLAIIEDLSQLLITHASVLHGIGGMAVAKLTLDRRNIARFRHDMLTHGMPSTVGCLAFNLRAQADGLPDIVDGEYG
jgi:hypothetical protein